MESKESVGCRGVSKIEFRKTGKQCYGANRGKKPIDSNQIQNTVVANRKAV